MIKNKLFFSIIPPFGSLFIRFIGRTTRWEKINFEKVIEYKNSKQPVIFAFWHGRLLMIPYLCVGKNPHVLISQHRDGELITRIIRSFGVKAIRGSTTRGGKEGFKRIAKVLQNGSDVVIAPDGPRGPAYKVQPGIIRLASITGYPILPIAYSTSRHKKLKSWDEFMLPLPFGKGAFVAGKELFVPPKATKEEYEEKRIHLEKLLTELTMTADSMVTTSPSKNNPYKTPKHPQKNEKSKEGKEATNSCIKA